MAKKSILTIEDCNAISYLIDTVLGKEFNVTSVDDCGDAISQLQLNPDRDVIILDIADAGSENLELLEHIHTSSVFKDIKTVVISNSDDETLRNKTVELGAALFLSKPFDPVYLSDRVKDLVRDKADAHRKRKNFFNLNIF